VKLPEKI